MAITKTTTVDSILVTYGGTEPVVHVNTVSSWDDPNDDSLPVSKSENKTINKMTTSTTFDSDTGEAINTESATDYSGEDAKVVAICDLVWADPDAE